jgi:hypothetical protein
VLSFSTFDTESGYDYVVVYDGPDESASQLGEFHGGSIPGNQTASGSQLFVKLTSDHIVEGDGFTAIFQCPGADSTAHKLSNADPCDGGVSLIDAGSLDGSHGSDAICSWALSCSNTSQVPVLSFSAFETEAGYDFVNIHDGVDETHTQVHALAGSDVPADVTASDAHLYIKLTSDGSVVGTGFTASFTCQGGGQGGGDGGDTIADATATVSIVVDGPFYTNGDVTVDFTGATDDTDWIAMYNVGDTPGDESSHDYSYHGSADVGSGSVTVTPTAAGDYFIVMLCCDGYTEVSARATITVVEASGRRLAETAVSQVKVRWPDRWGADWQESRNRPGRPTANQIVQHSIPDQVRDRHRKLLERHKQPGPSTNRSSSRRILQSGPGARAATPVGLVDQLSDLIGQPRKMNLQTRIVSGKIPRTNSNLDPDGVAKPPAPPKFVAPPPPSKPQATVLESLQDAGFKFNKQIEGYVFFVPAEFTIEHTKGDVQNLANFRWLDSRTRQLTIRLALYNGGFRRGRTHFQTFYGRQSLAFGLS